MSVVSLFRCGFCRLPRPAPRVCVPWAPPLVYCSYLCPLSPATRLLLVSASLGSAARLLLAANAAVPLCLRIVTAASSSYLNRSHHRFPSSHPDHLPPHPLSIIAHTHAMHSATSRGQQTHRGGCCITPQLQHPNKCNHPLTGMTSPPAVCFAVHHSSTPRPGWRPHALDALPPRPG